MVTPGRKLHHKKKKLKENARIKRRMLARKASGLKNEKTKFLLVCEGEKTEPNYFESFRGANISVVTEKAAGDPLNVVLKAIEMNPAKGRGKKKQTPYDSVWAIFDRDSFELDRINTAFQLADLNGINVAFSNEAFELWYLLHFEYRNTGMIRTEYAQALSNHLGFNYAKNSLEMYDLLFPFMQTAISNARRLAEVYEEKHPLVDRNPYTSVYLLVERLLKSM